MEVVAKRRTRSGGPAQYSDGLSPAKKPARSPAKKTAEKKKVKKPAKAKPPPLTCVRFLFIGAPWRRMIWVLLLVGAFAGFLSFVTGSIIQFANLPTVTKVSVEQPDKIEFPVITICNLNTFVKSKVSSMGGDPLLGAIESIDVFAPRISANDETDRENKFKILEQAGSMEELVTKAGINRFDFLPINDNNSATCVWKGDPCYHDDFTLTLTPFGNCYSFNKSPQPDFVSDGGILNGLTIALNIQQEEYLDSGFFDAAGIQVLIHSQRETPASVLSYGFSVFPGTVTTVRIRETRVKNLEQPFGVCDSGNPANYSINNCKDKCYYDALKQKCKCKEMYMRDFYQDDLPICSFRDFQCIQKLENILCRCLPPCEERLFDVELSQAQFPSNRGVEKWTKRLNKSESFVKTNFIWLNVFYPKILFILNEQQRSYTVNNLIGDIGGHMGLFIGASLLTLAEFIQCIVTKICDACKKKNKIDIDTKEESSTLKP